MKFLRVLLVILLSLVLIPAFALRLTAEPAAQLELAHHVFLPLITSTGCPDVPGETYRTLVPVSAPSDRPAEQHADLNLALRGYVETTGILDLIDVGGPVDGRGPKLYSLFADSRVPEFTGIAQVNAWNWVTNSRAGPILVPPVTLGHFQVAPSEVLRVPHSEYNIGTISRVPAEGVFLDAPADDPNKYEVLVLYASHERITLKYTREDNVISGYTLHVENICVAPGLLALYREWNAKGRAHLPALKQGQVLGRAIGQSVGVVIRDNGTFMDPRVRKDWW